MILQPWHFTGVAKKRGSDTLAKKSNNLQKRMISSACWAAAASLLLFYLGNRIFAYVDPTTLSSDYLTQILIGLDDMAVNPIAIRLTAPGLIIGALLLLIVWFAWGQHIVFMGNYRTGEESGSAKWADEKEMSAFLDSDDPSNNLLFTDKYGLAISRKKFDPEHDRNLNVCVIGGSGSGKTYRYVKPNLMQLNSNYFLTDPKGTLLDECGWLFADNGYKVMSFDMVRKDKSMHYNPLKYVRTDDEILTFVNCLILNTNGDKPNTGDAFWENSEKMLYTALIALMRDWFPENEYNLDTLLKLLSMAKASENDENYMSPLDKVFNQIETGYTEVAVADDDVAVANDMPFATQELNDEGGNYYGQNQSSSNLVICNRKKLTSPMGFVCGKTGSGKGMFVKQEMTGTILSNPEDEIIVFDRAGEYTEIARRYGGNVFDFAVNSDTFLNPLDITSSQRMSRVEQVAFKVDAMLAQAGASAFEAGANLSEIEQSIIQRCVEEAFARLETRRLSGEQDVPKSPILQDFYDILLEQPEVEAQAIALRYERYVKGSMSFFNKHSNVSFDSRIIDFNLKELPDNMLTFALINLCEAVRNRMYFNASHNVRAWLYVEEMQSMFAYPTVLRYFSRFANEGRKFGMLLTGITQNATAMLDNEAARNIVTNADFLMLLKQSPLDRKEWIRLLNLSEQEEECIDESTEPGNGLLIAGAARVPIRGKFPKDNALYELFSTNPNDKKELEERIARFGA